MTVLTTKDLKSAKITIQLISFTQIWNLTSSPLLRQTQLLAGVIIITPIHCYTLRLYTTTTKRGDILSPPGLFLTARVSTKVSLQNIFINFRLNLGKKNSKLLQFLLVYFLKIKLFLFLFMTWSNFFQGIITVVWSSLFSFRYIDFKKMNLVMERPL